MSEEGGCRFEQSADGRAIRGEGGRDWTGQATHEQITWTMVNMSRQRAMVQVLIVMTGSRAIFSDARIMVQVLG